MVRPQNTSFEVLDTQIPHDPPLLYLFLENSVLMTDFQSEFMISTVDLD
jgi:hypothetical protein